MPGGKLLGNLIVSFSSNERKKEADVLAAVTGEVMGRENADLLTPCRMLKGMLRKKEKKILKTQNSVLGKMGV